MPQKEERAEHRDQTAFQLLGLPAEPLHMLAAGAAQRDLAVFCSVIYYLLYNDSTR